MKKISTIIALLTILSLTGCVPEAEDLQTSVLNSQLYEVVRVVDGDTVVVDINGKDESLRLIGIDTPETVHPSKPV
ncbi:thermonuclease family protein, partial [Patescibacteria group bacterium]|nr:thermonuclease family protein [Patescibacteria group bacterium]